MYAFAFVCCVLRFRGCILWCNIKICTQRHTDQACSRLIKRYDTKGLTDRKIVGPRGREKLLYDIAHKQLIIQCVCFFLGDGIFNEMNMESLSVHRSYYNMECFVDQYKNNMFAFFTAGSEWPIYVGLAVVAVACVALGAILMRGSRKSRRLPPYSMARTGEFEFGVHFRVLHICVCSHKQ